MYHQKRSVVIGVLIGYGLIFTAGLVLATLVCTTVVNGEYLYYGVVGVLKAFPQISANVFHPFNSHLRANEHASLVRSELVFDDDLRPGNCHVDCF
jgi:hypothetical protein